MLLAMETFTVLADPTRRRIVELLATGDMGAGDIHRHFRMTGPAVSQHLKVLRDARLVSVRIAAQRRIYQLDPTGLAELDAWLDGIAPLWQKRLEALERERLEGVARQPLRERGPRRVID